MNRTPLTLAGLALLAAILACTFTPTPAPTETPADDAIATAVAATLTAAPGESPQPSQTSTATTTPPLCLPQHPGAQSLSLPQGVALGEATPESMALHDLAGNLLGNLSLTGLSWYEPGQVHLAGGFTGGVPNLPVVYHTLANNGALQLNLGGVISQLSQTPDDLVTIAGAPGEPYLAFSTNTTGPSGWISHLYATDYANAAAAQPLLTRDQGDGYVIWPLAVHVVSGGMQGVWYTESLYGIGNIIFHPYRGLFYLNLATSQVTTYLGTDIVLAGFSPDQSWVAFAPSPGGSPSFAQNGITLKSLLTCQEVYLPFDSGTNLDGGFVVFSPDNQLVAWLEAFGPNLMEAQTRLRVARNDGTLLVDTPSANLTGLVGGEVPTWLTPRGWAANHTLLLQISIEGVAQPQQVIWASDPNQPLDPALGANQSANIGEGQFLGFLYP